MVGADRSDSFSYLLERVISRLQGWKENFLSIGGKEILLKALLVFAMSVFNIPKKTFIKRSLMLSLDFGGEALRRKIKCTGGLGGRCVFQKNREVWVSEIYTLLI